MMKNENKKNDTAIYVKFVLVFVVAILAGAFMGAGLSIFKNLGIEINKEAAVETMRIVLPIIFGLFDMILIVIGMSVYAANAKMAKAWDGEDEDVIEKIEARQNLPLVLSSVLMIGGIALFSLCVYVNDVLRESKSDFLFLVYIILLLISIAGSIMIQASVINLEKKLNPEKQGNVFDFNFLKKWEKSSDEAEKLIQYKGAYKAYVATHGACMALWLICFCGMLIFNTGILAVIAVCFIWLFMSIVYSIEVSRLEKGKR